VPDLDVSLEKNMIQMQQGKEARIGSSPFQKRSEIETAEPGRENVGCDSAPPLIEISQDDFGASSLLLIQNVAQAFSLILPFPQSGAQMHVVHMQDLSVDFEVGTLAASASPSFPSQGMLGVIDNRKSAENHIPEGGPASETGRGHDPAHAQGRAKDFILTSALGPNPQNFLESDDIGFES